MGAKEAEESCQGEGLEEGFAACDGEAFDAWEGLGPSKKLQRSQKLAGLDGLCIGIEASRAASWAALQPDHPAPARAVHLTCLEQGMHIQHILAHALIFAAPDR